LGERSHNAARGTTGHGSRCCCSEPSGSDHRSYSWDCEKTQPRQKTPEPTDDRTDTRTGFGTFDAIICAIMIAVVPVGDFPAARRLGIIPIVGVARDDTYVIRPQTRRFKIPHDLLGIRIAVVET
jgi:hypothetical protein